MLKKVILRTRIATLFVDRVTEESLPFDITIGKTYNDENHTQQTDLLVEYEDKELLNSTIESIINDTIL